MRGNAIEVTRLIIATDGDRQLRDDVCRHEGTNSRIMRDNIDQHPPSLNENKSFTIHRNHIAAYIVA